MTELMIVITIGWLIATTFFLFSSRNYNERFKIANALSVGVLGLVYGKRRPSEITNREKVGLLLLITVFVVVVLATYTDYIQ
jgi:hypothetical protein